MLSVGRVKTEQAALSWIVHQVGVMKYVEIFARVHIYALQKHAAEKSLLVSVMK